MWVRGHGRSLEMTPFDRTHTSSYWRFIVRSAFKCIQVCLYRSLSLSDFRVLDNASFQSLSEDSITRHNAPHRNSAGTPPALARMQKNTTRFKLLAECRRHAAGCRKLSRYGLLSRGFCRTESACGAVRNPHVMIETRNTLTGQPGSTAVEVCSRRRIGIRRLYRCRCRCSRTRRRCRPGRRDASPSTRHHRRQQSAAALPCGLRTVAAELHRTSAAV